MEKKSLLITGGAGFIGSALTRRLVFDSSYNIINLDKLTYAGNLASLKPVTEAKNYHFIQGDICDKSLVESILNTHKPFAIMHLAAESHVDRSIDRPSDFIQTNILGTFTLLECALDFWRKQKENSSFRFLHISTDEVYGTLGETGFFHETTAYDPSSPYSASKASSDHLVRAWNRTYGLPTIITNCSNNYGPYQFPEKLIPLVIQNALSGKPLPIYGDGKQIRDWLYVEDHVDALIAVLNRGKVGSTYNVGGDSEKQNIDVVKTICKVLDLTVPTSPYKPHEKLITYVTDRPGHDRRYAIDCEKIKNELAWKQKESFLTGIEKTVDWYLKNQDWVKIVLDQKYAGQRLGLKR